MSPEEDYRFDVAGYLILRPRRGDIITYKSRNLD